MDAVLERLRAIAGAGHVSTDPLECDYFAQDVFTRDIPAAVVVAPGDVEQLAALVGVAVAAGMAVVPRGGGMSYTSGYVPAEPGSVLLDMSRMNRVLEINREDMYVRVEAGISWQALHEALQPLGLRTPYWGTLSGRFATVGGSLSQNSIFWGSGRHGSAADSVLSMEVVLADGSLLNTGSAAQRHARPFFRHFGPDLTGLFTGDGGALGVKANVTLRLLPDAGERAFGSFAFDRYPEMTAAMSDIARADLASECFGFDPYLQQQRMKRESLAKDASQFAGLLKSAGGVGKALKEGARTALAGRRFMDDVLWSFHVICEERTGPAAEYCLAKVLEIVERHGGRALPDSIPRIVRANPFGPVNNMLGPAGERWVPVHGLVSHSAASDAIGRVEALFARHAAEFEALGIRNGYLLATVGTHCFVVEPVFFWPDAIEEMHRRSVEPDHLRRLEGFEANPPARALVTQVKDELSELFSAMGAVHLQVGKAYQYAQGLRPEPLALVRKIKKALDPNNRMNPGCLGL
jgi:FAD/FMN-containing dehydrogenase